MPATAGWPMAGGDHDHMAMMEEDERRTCWAHFAKIGLGLWLAASPLIYDAVTTETVCRRSGGAPAR